MFDLALRTFISLFVIGATLHFALGAFPLGMIIVLCSLGFAILALKEGLRAASYTSEDHLNVTNTGFRLKDQTYAFADVQHIKFYNLITTVTGNFSKREQQKVTVEIALRGVATVVKVTAGPTLAILGRGVGKPDSKQLIEKYEIIRQHSFDARAHDYIASLHTFGYFVYDGKRIHQNGDVDHPAGKFNLISRKSDLRRKPFMVFLEDKRWVAKVFVLKPPLAFDTRVDADVFVALLNKLFDIRWN